MLVSVCYLKMRLFRSAHTPPHSKHQNAYGKAKGSICISALQSRELRIPCDGQADLQKQQQRADGLVKEKAEMEADLELLRANEANAGVSREHIEVLQHQLELAK